MKLYPIIRTTRAISACLIYPEHPLQAIAISEIISSIGPIFNPNIYNKTIALIIAFMYAPKFSYYFIDEINNKENLYYQFEICTSLIFITISSLNYINEIVLTN